MLTLPRVLLVSLLAGVLLSLVSPSARAETTTVGGTAYAAQCKAKGVPLPPNWGGNMLWKLNNVAGVGTSNRGKWRDGFTGLTGAVYGYQSTSATEPGVCVLAAHDEELFDVICQGTNGKACFWEGIQRPDPPAQPVVLASTTQSTTFVKGGTDLGNANCTRCHVGQNAFINHYDELFQGGGTHPMNLRYMTGYMIQNIWYDPIVPASWHANAPADKFPGYPASNTKCRDCHKPGAYGGDFPALSSTSDGYCSILSSITDRPSVGWFSDGTVESRGGMPASGVNTCTPGTNCAKQIDPFVKAMLEVGCTSPLSSTWASWQKNRVSGNPDYSSPERNNLPTGRTFIYSKDPIRLTPSAWTNVESSGSTWDRVTFAVGLGSRMSFWTKGSATSRVTSYYSPDYARNEIWEYDNASGGSAARHATEAASVFPAGLPFGFRRHNGKSAIFYRGTDNALHRVDWGTSWTYSALPRDLSGMGDSWAAKSDPDVHKRSSGSDSLIFRQMNCDKCIGEYRFAGTSTYFYTIALPVNIKNGTQPVGFRDSAGYSMIFATTSDGGVYQIKDGTTTNANNEYAAPVRLFLDTKVSSSPRPFTRPDGKTAFVYTRELNTGSGVHKIGYLYNVSGNTWYGEDPTYSANDGLSENESEPTVGDAIGFVNASNREVIIFRGASQAVYQLERDPATSKWKRTKLYTPSF
jgi:hypothetical protein